MGFNDNRKLRPEALLLLADGTVSPIRREERLEDDLAAFAFDGDNLALDAPAAFEQLANRRGSWF
jgi:hypothetical protein